VQAKIFLQFMNLKSQDLCVLIELYKLNTQTHNLKGETRRYWL